MFKLILSLFRLLFLRKRFYRFNRFLHDLALRGMGILNFESDKLSGEEWLLRTATRGRLRVVLDIGANLGSYSAEVRANNEGARVFSFEPHPQTFTKLQESAGRYGFTAVNAAVGDESGSIELFDYADRDGSQHASIYRSVIEDIHASKAACFRVPMTTIDEFLAANRVDHIDLLKIDTEGNEYKVLCGAKQALAEGRIDLVHFEFNVTNVVSRVFMKDFMDILTNYSLFRLLPDGIVPLRRYGVDVTDIEIFAYQNIVAVSRNTRIISERHLSA